MALKDDEGRWIDGTGDAIPPKYIDKWDKDQDRLVNKLIKKAEKVNDAISKLRDECFDEIEKFMDETEKQYDIKVKTKGGNKSLTDFSHTMKVDLVVAHQIRFDDRLALAKSIIDECIKKWSKGSDDKIRLLIEQAFQVDKKGNLDKDRVLGLKKLKIKDEDWKRAMQIINDSTKVVGSKRYIRFAMKNAKDQWTSIPIDIARV